MKRWNNISISEKLEASKLTGGEKIKVKTIVVLGFVLMVLMSMTAIAEAKTYNDYAGHSAVQYPHSDVSSSLKPYVDHVEYDTAYGRGSGYGVRLYLTSYGKNCIKYFHPGVLISVTSAVMSAPEWDDERSVASVRSEIYQHTVWGRTTIHIEYYYQDLQPWELPYRNL